MLMQDVMVDLETLGVRPGAAILSVGAVAFGPDGLMPRESAFYTVVSRASCRAAGLHEDPGTLEWWERQSPEAREVIDAAAAETAPPLAAALGQFSSWLRALGPGVRVWGNGADFDNALLAAAYAAANQPLGWGAYNGRCYRTLKALRPGVKRPARVGTHHNALDDAVFQATHAVQLGRALGLWSAL